MNAHDLMLEAAFTMVCMNVTGETQMTRREIRRATGVSDKTLTKMAAVAGEIREVAPSVDLLTLLWIDTPKRVTTTSPRSG
jgi:hypothetical protein